MSLTIPLDTDVERRLAEEATRQGVAPAEYAKRLIEQHLPQPKRRQSLSDLFSKWEAEDFTDDPAEIARRNREYEELKRQMNANREASEGPNARKPFPDTP